MLTKVYFVRHAQPDFTHADDLTRPLTAEGLSDRATVLDTLKDKSIDVFYCSPYKRSLDTVAPAAEYFGKSIHTDARLRERDKGAGGNNAEMFAKRWADHSWHEAGGECIASVRSRNIEALNGILKANSGKNIVIGTHGTSLSTVMNYFRPECGLDYFLRIIDWMPYIVEFDFEGEKLVGITEHAHITKVFK